MALVHFYILDVLPLSQHHSIKALNLTQITDDNQSPAGLPLRCFIHQLISNRRDTVAFTLGPSASTLNVYNIVNLLL